MPERPVLDQVNLVVRDMDAMVAFYRTLGIDFEDPEPPWDAHHRGAIDAGAVDLDLDSHRFASVWNEGQPADRAGAVLTFRFETRGGVDDAHQRLVAAGYVSEQAPKDAFFGCRLAIVRDPDGNGVCLLSPRDNSMVTPPPDMS